MVQRVYYRGAIGAFDLHTQVKCAIVDQVTPSLTNVGEPAPHEAVIPTILVVQPIAVEYSEEYIIIEPMDSRVVCIVSSLGCRRQQS